MGVGPGLTAVQNAVDAATAGDTVEVNSGSTSWSGQLTIDKDITVIGAGIGNTVITRNGGAVHMDNINGGRLSGFTFTGNGARIDVEDCIGWRVDHCRIVNTNGSIDDLIDVYSNTTPTVTFCKGLVDNCEGVDGRILSRGTAWLRQDGGYKPMQDILWTEDFAYGSDNYLYIEDCEFWATFVCPAVDANYGGRFVFRHNTVHNGYVEAHSVQGNNRGARRWEVYNNTFVWDDVVNHPDGVWVPMFIRGGTGVVYGNTIDDYNNGIALNNVRDTEDRGYGACDGGSNWDQNTAGESGWACRDQIGRGYDTDVWDIGESYTQISDPAYLWNNVDEFSAAVDPFVHNAGAKLHIVEDRDYYLSSKPGYSGYSYPHPLQGGDARADGVKAGDTPEANAQWGVSVSDGIKLSEAIGPSFVNAEPMLKTDGVDISDAQEVQALWYVSVVDGIKVDGVERGTATMYLSTLDGMKIGDTPARPQDAVGRLGISFVESRPTVGLTSAAPSITFAGTKG